MSVASSSIDSLVPAATQRAGLLSVYFQLTKARLSALVVFTSAAGYLAACAGTVLDWTTLIATVTGTALAAAGACTLNQVLEWRRDSLMHRTRTRPIPAGDISSLHATIAGLVLGLGGCALMLLVVNDLAAWLTFASLALYVVVYTPLKTMTSLNTLVGAIVGALPPMIGWAGATGSLSEGAWLLGALLFIWQLPHFFALAWMYREDYARGSFRMLPTVDIDGRLTRQVILVTSMMLLPIGLLLTMAGVSGPIFALGSVIGACVMVALAAKLTWQLNHANARRIFLASILYLPLVLCLLVLDASPVAPWSSSQIISSRAVSHAAIGAMEGESPSPLSADSSES